MDQLQSAEAKNGEISVAAENLIKVDHPNMLVIVPRKSQEMMAAELQRLAGDEVKKYQMPKPGSGLTELLKMKSEELPISGWPVIVFGKEFFEKGKVAEKKAMMEKQTIENWKARDWLVFAFDHLFSQLMESESEWGDRPPLDKDRLKSGMLEAERLLDKLNKENRTWVSWYGSMVKILRESLYEKKLAGVTIVITGAEDQLTKALAGVSHLSRWNPQVNVIALSSSSDISLSIPDKKVSPFSECGLRSDLYETMKFQDLLE